MDRQDPRVTFVAYRGLTIEAGAYRKETHWHPEYRVLNSLETVIYMQRPDTGCCTNHQAAVDAAIELAKDRIETMLFSNLE